MILMHGTKWWVGGFKSWDVSIRCKDACKGFVAVNVGFVVSLLDVKRAHESFIGFKEVVIQFCHSLIFHTTKPTSKHPKYPTLKQD